MVELKIQLEAEVAERLSAQARSLGYESSESFLLSLVLGQTEPDLSGPHNYTEDELHRLIESRLDRAEYIEVTDETWADLERRIAETLGDGQAAQEHFTTAGRS